MRPYPFSVYYLFVQSFLMNTGFFMLIPMLSIHYLGTGLSALFIGNLYAVRILSQQGLQIFGGYVSDRLPYQWVIFVGTLIRAVGFALFALLPPSSWLYLAAFLFGIGGALFGPAGNAAMVLLIPIEERAKAFAIRQTTSNIGTTVGPLLGAFLVFDHFTEICWIAGGLFLVTGISSLFILPKRHIESTSISFFQGMKGVIQNRVFLKSVGWFMGYYVIYQQMYIAIPDTLQAMHAPKYALGELFALEALLEIAAAYPVIAWMNRAKDRLTAPKQMSIGLYLMGITWIPMIFHVNIWTILFPVIGLSVGSIIALPSRQTFTSEWADQTYISTYFGISSLSMAFGASIGASGGGLLMHSAVHMAIGPVQSLPASIFLVIALFSGYLISRLPIKRTDPSQPSAHSV